MTTDLIHRRAIGLNKPGHVPSHTTSLVRGERNTGPFETLGKQLLCIRDSAIRETTGRPYIDPRLIELQKRAQPAGAGEQIPSIGGFLIQPEFVHDIVKRMYNTGEILSRCFTFPVTAPHTNGVRYPSFDETSRANGSRLGGIQSYWQNESDAITASKPKLMASELTCHKLTTLIYLTNELLQDSDALTNWASYATAQELVFSLENKIVNGSGQLQPQGILNSPAVVTIQPESGQASGTVNSANVEKMMGGFWSQSYMSDGACWIVNQALLPQLASLQLVVGTAGAESKLFQWATSVQEYDLLGGFPVLLSEYAQVPGTSGDIILADLSRYIVAMREAIQNTLSLEIRFLTDEAAFRAILRVNGQTIDRAPVNPLNGTQLTSPFVTLAARP